MTEQGWAHCYNFPLYDVFYTIDQKNNNFTITRSEISKRGALLKTIEIRHFNQII